MLICTRAVPPTNPLVTQTDDAVELSTYTLRCSVLSNPQAEIVWLKRTSSDITVVFNSSRIQIRNDFTLSSSGQPMSVSDLVISEAFVMDSGEYICEARPTFETDSLISTVFANKTVTVTGICKNYTCHIYTVYT